MRLVAVIALALGHAVAAEEPAAALLSGRVQTMGTREPVTAHLQAGDAGTETDPDGRFQLSLPAGPQQVQVTAAGHEGRTFDENLAPASRVEVVYRLTRTTVAFETVVRARRDTEAPRVELSREELHDVAGTQGDPFRVAMLLPGVASIASGLPYPVVRGTQPAATGFFLDGVRLPQLFHLLAGPAVVHPDFIERVDYFSGAVPLAYGRLLGGVLDGKVARPADSFHATASVDLINAGAFVTVPIDSAKLKLSLAGRVSYTPLIGAAVANAAIPSTPQAPHGTPVANFYDYQARVEWTAGSGRLRLLALGSSDEAGVRQTTADTFTAIVTQSFHRADLAWRWSAHGALAEAGLTVGTERLGLLGERDGQLFGQFLMHRDEAVAHARWTGPLVESLILDAGAELSRQFTGLSVDRTAGVLSGQASSFRAPDSSGLLIDGWAELTWRAGRFTTTAGLRFDSYYLEPDLTLASAEPRASVRFAAFEWLALRAAAGLANQPPTVLVNLPVSDLAGLRDGLQRGARFEVGADAVVPRLLGGLELSVSAYLNPTFRAVEYSLEDLLLNRPQLGAGAPGIGGRSWGLELMVRRRAQGRWFGWVSYSLGRAERLRRVYTFDVTGELTGSRVLWIPFDFDETHVVNLTAGVLLPHGFKVSTGLHFNSGRPEAGVVSSRAMTPGIEAGTWQPAWVPVSLAAVPRLPPFLRLDARVSRTWTWPDFVFELYLDVLNATASQEVLAYTYGYGLDAANQRTLVKKTLAIPLLLPFLGVKAAY